MRNNVTEWKLAGGIMVLVGIIAVFTGRAGLTYYGHAEGLGARVVGVLMVIGGIKLIFPKK